MIGITYYIVGKGFPKANLTTMSIPKDIVKSSSAAFIINNVQIKVFEHKYLKK